MLIEKYSISRNDWTKTTHMRAIDFWVILCYMGTFFALMEYCVILCLTKTSKPEKETKTNILIQNEEAQDLAGNKHQKPKKNRKLILANIMEKIAQFLLPFYNIAFPICYFMVCTLASP